MVSEGGSVRSSRGESGEAGREGGTKRRGASAAERGGVAGDGRSRRAGEMHAVAREGASQGWDRAAEWSNI